jgi:AraC family transcriptional regulator
MKIVPVRTPITENTFRAMSPTMNLPVDSVQDSIMPMRQNSTAPSAASPSRRVGYLVMRAMTFFDSNREAAWNCLKDASTLLRGEPNESPLNAPTRPRDFRRGGLAPWQTKRALEYIEGNLESKLTLQDMAESVAMSASHFSRAFKQSLGCSPMNYVSARRIERAKRMMTSTRERLATIAVACGFTDQPHLNNRFRRAEGMSPGLWRRISTLDPEASCMPTEEERYLPMARR